MNVDLRWRVETCKIDPQNHRKIYGIGIASASLPQARPARQATSSRNSYRCGACCSKATPVQVAMHDGFSLGSRCTNCEKINLSLVCPLQLHRELHSDEINIYFRFVAHCQQFVIGYSRRVSSQRHLWLVIAFAVATD